MSIVVRDERLARRIGHKQDGASIERASDDEVGDADGGVAGAGSALLRRSLRAADVVALAVAWTLTQLLWPTPASSVGVLLLVGLVPFVAAGCWLIAKQRLYLARVATMRTVEQAGLARVGAAADRRRRGLDGIRGVEMRARSDPRRRSALVHQPLGGSHHLPRLAHGRPSGRPVHPARA